MNAPNWISGYTNLYLSKRKVDFLIIFFKYLSAQKYREMQRQRWDMVCEHVDNFRQLRTWLTVRVTLDSICNTCNVFFLFLKSDLLTLAQQTPEEQPRHGTNIIYNFLQILMLKNTNSPEGRLSKDLQKTWPSINFFSNLILGLLEISESVWNLNLSSNSIEVADSYICWFLTVIVSRGITINSWVALNILRYLSLNALQQGVTGDWESLKVNAGKVSSSANLENLPFYTSLSAHI